MGVVIWEVGCGDIGDGGCRGERWAGDVSDIDMLDMDMIFSDSTLLGNNGD